VDGVPVFSRRDDSRKKPKSPPSVEGMLAREPNGSPLSDHKNRLADFGCFRSRLGGGDLFSGRRAVFAKRAMGAERILWQTD